MARSRPTAETQGKASRSKAAKDVTPKNGVQKAKRVPRGSNRDWSQYSHNLPGQTELAKNGRQTGRNLIAWTRPRMAEKLLLHIEYEALLHNRPVPWDAVAHRFNPGSSGDAITQRLTRMRKELIAEGHLVPPLPQRPGGAVEDVTVRGFIRANPDRVDDAYTTRRVLWTEPVDDLKKPLGNAVYAPHGQNRNEGDNDKGDNDMGDNDEDDFDEDDDANDLDQKSLSSVRPSGSSAIHLNKGKDPVRPARSARPARSTVKKMSYAEDQDDIFNDGSAKESDEGYEENEDENQDKERGVSSGSHSNPHISRIQHAARSQSHASGAHGRRHRHGRGLNAEALDQVSDFPNPYGAQTPERPGQGISHMSPYGMTPNGVHWLHGHMGLPMIPMGMGMGMGMGIGMDMMSGFNTTPTRSSAFTTQASSPASFDVEDASPRSAAFFQAHLNEYNSPTPRGHADFNPMVPTPMGMMPMNASMLFGANMMSRNTTVAGNGTRPDNGVTSGNETMPDNSNASGKDTIPGIGTMPDNGTMSSSATLQRGDPTLAPMVDDDANMPQDSIDAEFSSIFSDSDTALKRLEEADGDE